MMQLHAQPDFELMILWINCYRLSSYKMIIPDRRLQNPNITTPDPGPQYYPLLNGLTFFHLQCSVFLGYFLYVDVQDMLDSNYWHVFTMIYYTSVTQMLVECDIFRTHVYMMTEWPVMIQTVHGSLRERNGGSTTGMNLMTGTGEELTTTSTPPTNINIRQIYPSLKTSCNDFAFRILHCRKNSYIYKLLYQYCFIVLLFLGFLVFDFFG